MEHEQIAAQVKKLTGKNNDAAYAALCTLEAESEASAAVCAFWDAFAAMLDDKRTYVRMRGMVLLACNAQWAGPEQVMEMLERVSCPHHRRKGGRCTLVRSTAAPVCSSLPGLLSASQTGAPVRGPFPLLRKHGLFAGTGYSRRSEAAAGEIKQKTRFPQSGCPFQGRRVLGMSVQRSTSAYSGCWPNHFFA